MTWLLKIRQKKSILKIVDTKQNNNNNNKNSKMRSRQTYLSFWPKFWSHHIIVLSCRFYCRTARFIVDAISIVDLFVFIQQLIQPWHVVVTVSFIGRRHIVLLGIIVTVRIRLFIILKTFFDEFLKYWTGAFQ